MQRMYWTFSYLKVSCFNFPYKEKENLRLGFSQLVTERDEDRT
jgi:hypothetical protein